MVVTLASRLSNDIPSCSVTNCYYLPRCIPLDRMNYKDALNVSINDKLTKAKLIDIAHTLQDRCLLSELDKPTLISPQSYIKDVRARMDIDHRERMAFLKDIVNLGRNTRQVLVTAMDNMDVGNT